MKYYIEVRVKKIMLNIKKNLSCGFTASNRFEGIAKTSNCKYSTQRLTAEQTEDIH